jgi:hypothetical protein
MDFLFTKKKRSRWTSMLILKKVLEVLYINAHTRAAVGALEGLNTQQGPLRIPLSSIPSSFK